jgi:hypothetical protein
LTVTRVGEDVSEFSGDVLNDRDKRVLHLRHLARVPVDGVRGDHRRADRDAVDVEPTYDTSAAVAVTLTLPRTVAPFADW